MLDSATSGTTGGGCLCSDRVESVKTRIHFTKLARDGLPQDFLMVSQTFTPFHAPARSQSSAPSRSTALKLCRGAHTGRRQRTAHAGAWRRQQPGSAVNASGMQSVCHTHCCLSCPSFLALLPKHRLTSPRPCPQTPQGHGATRRGAEHLTLRIIGLPISKPRELSVPPGGARAPGARRRVPGGPRAPPGNKQAWWE